MVGQVIMYLSKDFLWEVRERKCVCVPPVLGNWLAVIAAPLSLLPRMLQTNAQGREQKLRAFITVLGERMK